MSGKLQAIAQRANVAVLALAQLNREPDKGNEKGRLPRMSDLADSAQIERDADLIALLHRPRGPDESGEDALLAVVKQRDGECDGVALHFNKTLCRFENSQPQHP